MRTKNGLTAAIAATRFSIGAKPGDIVHAQQGPREWLKAQLTPPIFNKRLPSSSQALSLHVDFKERKKQLDSEMEKSGSAMSKDEYKLRLKDVRPQKHALKYTSDSIISSVSANNGLSWRLLDFFSNHFSVSMSNALMRFVAPTLEREAIAPHLFGSFEQMLIAVETHPAMIIYLNNEKSYGPKSKMAQKSKKRGLNENLAREILELHTLGVEGGYQQNDVIALAKALSGWSVTRRKEKSSNRGFVFRERGHEPGPQKIMGKVYANTGLYQGISVLKDLARHPATANFLCTKLARHFVSDIPNTSLVNRMTSVWLETGGNLSRVIKSLIDCEEAWLPQQQKFKSPREFVVSVGRLALPKRWPERQIRNSLADLGQRPFSAGSPAGFGDTGSSWDGADALHARIEWSSQYAKRIRANALEMAEQGLGPLLQATTRRALEQAESQKQARILLFMSPEFLRR